MKLAIIVGHTAKAPGAFGVPPINKNEYGYNKELAAHIFMHAKNIGQDAKVFFRDKVGIAGVYKQVNEWGADLAIELHFNALNGQVQGTETLCGTSVPESVDFAKAIQAAQVKHLAREKKLNRGVHVLEVKDKNRGYLNVNSANCPSCLIEPFFGDNRHEAVLAMDKQMVLGQGLAQACLDWLNLQNK